MEKNILILPIYWAGYLINGDLDGYENTELEEMKEIEKTYGNCVDVSEEKYFSWRNDSNNIGGDVSEFTFIKY